MKILKRILIGLVGIAVLILIVAGIVKNDYAVQREIVINKPKQQVFDYLKFLKNQDNWSKWASLDPNMKKEFKGTDATVGFTSSWVSDKAGTGEQEIKKITDGERIDYELRFLKPMKSTSEAYMTTESVDSNHTKIKWGFTGSIPYPMNIIMVFMDMDKEVGKDFETGLNNLKGILEKQ